MFADALEEYSGRGESGILILVVGVVVVPVEEPVVFEGFFGELAKLAAFFFGGAAQAFAAVDEAGDAHYLE